eukprot:CAMPEP_0118939208 /NCGR_PEP_ID=MMETSP1169-20130426/28280_1 /TAXON_ID=36882 /ORGANISM="Pyramimonas obovata, Strain CCMP722" /LENGTH=129 /DNA_ID=CAMNT_0006883413 /DNA_START=258 /DNA_END=646 /DNA_ORIENTATION=-
MSRIGISMSSRLPQKSNELKRTTSLVAGAIESSPTYRREKYHRAAEQPIAPDANAPKPNMLKVEISAALHVKGSRDDEAGSTCHLCKLRTDQHPERQQVWPSIQDEPVALFSGGSGARVSRDGPMDTSS